MKTQTYRHSVNLDFFQQAHELSDKNYGTTRAVKIACHVR